MSKFKLSIKEAKAFNILDFEVDFLFSPPSIKEKTVENIDKYISLKVQSFTECINTTFEERCLHNHFYQFNTFKYCNRVFEKINGKELRIEKEVNNAVTNSIGLQNFRVKYVLINSRNILRKYYLNCNLQSMENHSSSF